MITGRVLRRIVPRPAALFAASVLTVVSTPSQGRAAETACWFENGAVVVPAEIGGVAGDWLLDPSSAHTLLHDTRADMEGLPRTFTAAGRLADLTLPPTAVTVADLDDRAPGFATPITGVIGADLLSRYTIDLAFAPCRVRIHAGRAPGLAHARALPLVLVHGMPAVRAAVSDDRRARAGLFAVDWGSRAAVRLADADLRPAATGLDPTPRRLAPARLRALSVDGRLYEEVSAATAEGLDPALAGALGLEFWARWRLRLDIAGGALWLVPQ